VFECGGIRPALLHLEYEEEKGYGGRQFLPAKSWVSLPYNVMKHQNIILDSFKESFNLIRKHKLLVLALFLVQLVFISSLAFVSVVYAFKIMGEAQDVIGYLEQQDLSDEAVSANMLIGGNILGDNPMMLYRTASQIILDAATLVVLALLSYLLFGCLGWAITDGLLNKKSFKSFFQYALKFKAVTLFYLFLIIVLSYVVVRSIPSLDEAKLASFLPLLFIIVILYFMFILIPLIGKNKLKDAAKKTWLIGTRKPHIVGFVHLINLVVIAVFSVLFFLSVDLPFFVVIAAGAVFVAALVWARIFLMVAINKIKV